MAENDNGTTFDRPARKYHGFSSPAECRRALSDAIYGSSETVPLEVRYANKVRITHTRATGDVCADSRY